MPFVRIHDGSRRSRHDPVPHAGNEARWGGEGDHDVREGGVADGERDLGQDRAGGLARGVGLNRDLDRVRAATRVPEAQRQVQEPVRVGREERLRDAGALVDGYMVSTRDYIVRFVEPTTD